MNEVATVEQQLLGLAKRIRAEHKATEIAVTRGLEHALAAGDLLIEAKQLVGHGEWLPWLAKHCDLPERTAQLYMRCANNRGVIEQAATKSATVADLTLRNAASVLANPKPKTTGKITTNEPYDPNANYLCPDSVGPDVLEYLRKEHGIVPAPAAASETAAVDANPGDDDQIIWRRGLMFRARSATADAAYEDWSQFRVDDELIDVVLGAATAWATLGKYLQRMTLRARAISAPAAEPLVDDGIPEFLRRGAVS